jgi:hypothetical protein
LNLNAKRSGIRSPFSECYALLDREEELWLEQRPKVIEAIKRDAVALREKSAQMRANRAAVNAAKTASNRP